MTRRQKLTGTEWNLVFKLRCKSKSGGVLSRSKLALVEKASMEDPDKYGAMEIDIFNSTAPFGSYTRRKS